MAFREPKRLSEKPIHEITNFDCQILEGVRSKNLEAIILFDFSKVFDTIHREKMEKILLTYGLPKETIAVIMMLYKNMKVKICSPDGDNIYRFNERQQFQAGKERSKRYPTQTITDVDYSDGIALLANTLTQTESLLHSLERAAGGIGLHINADRICALIKEVTCPH